MAGRGGVLNPNTLRRIQELDSRIETLRNEQRQTASLLERDPDVERLRAAMERSAAERRSRDAALASVERELAAVSERARTMHKRLYGGSVRNPQELLEMQHELDTLTARVAELEERALTAMEATERAEQAASADSSALQDAERRRVAGAGPLQKRLASLLSTLQTTESERETTFAGLSASERSLYTRVAAHHRPAVVSIAGDVCGGCRLPLSTEERRSTRSGDRIVQCSNCDRILVP